MAGNRASIKADFAKKSKRERLGVIRMVVTLHPRKFLSRLGDHMFISPSDVLGILEHYKYLVIFPIAVIEGPIIIVISGFLVYMGFLNVYVAYVVLVVADTIGDSLYYLVGKYWGRSAWIMKIG